MRFAQGCIYEKAVRGFEVSYGEQSKTSICSPICSPVLICSPGLDLKDGIVSGRCTALAQVEVVGTWAGSGKLSGFRV